MFNRNETASIDVDAQRGFTPLCPDELPVPEGDRIAEELNKQAEYACIRIGSKDAHPPNGAWIADPPLFPQFSMVFPKLKNVDIRWNRHCQVGTIGFELLDGLPRPIEYDYFVWKGIEYDLHPYGIAYHDIMETKSTGLIEFLKSKNIKLVICSGLAYSFCVRNTALQLKKAGFEVIVNMSATRDIPGYKEDTDKILKDNEIIIINKTEELGNYII